MMSRFQFYWENFLMMVNNQYEREIILVANQPIGFTTVRDAINAVIGTKHFCILHLRSILDIATDYCLFIFPQKYIMLV